MSHKTVNISIGPDGNIKVDVSPNNPDYPPLTIEVVGRGSDGVRTTKVGKTKMIAKSLSTDLVMKSELKASPALPPGTYDVTVDCSGEVYTGSVTVPPNEPSAKSQLVFISASKSHTHPD